MHASGARSDHSWGSFWDKLWGTRAFAFGAGVGPAFGPAARAVVSGSCLASFSGSHIGDVYYVGLLRWVSLGFVAPIWRAPFGGHVGGARPAGLAGPPLGGALFGNGCPPHPLKQMFKIKGSESYTVCTPYRAHKLLIVGDPLTKARHARLRVRDRTRVCWANAIYKIVLCRRNCVIYA